MPIGPTPSGGEVTILSATVELTDAEIKALPTTPIVIVPATEVLNYSGLPTHLPAPLAFSVSLNSSAGAYTNIGGTDSIVLALGSDWSSNGLEADQGQLVALDDDVPAVGIANSFHKALSADFIHPLRVTSGGLQDNALAIAISNGGAGNLTGGNPANTMKVTVFYTIIDV